MAHPKSRISKQRKRKRRTHKKAVAPMVATCQVTGEKHLRHQTYNDIDGNVYYRGKLFIEAEVVEEDIEVTEVDSEGETGEE